MKHLLTMVVLLASLGGCEAENTSGLTVSVQDVPPRGVALTIDAGAVSQADTITDLQVADLQVADLLTIVAIDAGASKSDVLAAKPDTTPETQPPVGVLTYLGSNPCGVATGTATAKAMLTMYSGWDPATGRCYTTAPKTWTTSGACSFYSTDPAVIAFYAEHPSSLTCGTTYAPGTVSIWDSTDPRFHYLGDSSGGTVCLPNLVPYMFPC